jgi:hypothetical protein
MLDDVDAVLHQQDPVHGQHAVARSRRDVLEGRGVGARGDHAALGQPARTVLGDTRDAAVVADVGDGVGEVPGPAGAHQSDVTRAGFGAGPLRGRGEVIGRDAVPALEHLDTTRGRDVEQHTSRDHRRNAFCAVLGVRPAALSSLGVDAAVQAPVLTDVRERVDVGADVAPGDDELIGGGPAIGTHAVAVAADQRHPEPGMVR